MSDMWIDPAEDPRTYGNPVGELATYREYLANYRVTVELKCGGLDPEQLARRSVPPSTLSLIGLVRHLARVEHHWFRRVLEGQDEPKLFTRPDDNDWAFTGAVAEQPVVEEAFAAWQGQIAAADAWLSRQTDADMPTEVPLDDGTVSVRDVLVHLIEEYARHAGHADLLRECIDGRTGQ